MTKSLKVDTIKKAPGKIKAYSIVVNIEGNTKQPDNKFTLSKSVINKESKQSQEEPYNLNYVTPYVAPESLKLMLEQSPYFFRGASFKSACISGIGYSFEPVDTSQKDYFKDPEYVKAVEFCEDEVNDLGESFEDVVGGFSFENEVFGHSFLELVPDLNKEVRELYNLPAYKSRIHYDKRFAKMIDRISVIELTNGQTATRFKLMGSTKKNDDHEVLWLKKYNPFSRYYGFPDIYPATMDVALDKTSKEYNLRGFSNDLLVSFAIIVRGGELATETLSDIEKFLSANYKGVHNAQRALYLQSDDPEVNIDIKELDKKVRDMSFNKLSENSRDNIIVSLGLLAAMMGIKTPGQLGGTTELEVLFRIFNETIVMPGKRKLQSALNRLFKNRLGINKFKFVLKDLTFEKFADMITFANTLTDKKPLKQNEVRSYLGYDLIDEDEESDSELESFLNIQAELKNITTLLSNANK